MKAVLTTRCGCRREMETTYPPPPVIVVPLLLGFRQYGANEPEPYPESGPGMRTRRFLLEYPGWDDKGICSYVEEDPK